MKKIVTGVVMLVVGHLYAQVGSSVVRTISNEGANRWYTGSRAPLSQEYFMKLPVTAFVPGGWLRKQLELQRDGLMGNLGEISIWLQKKDNAWLDKEGRGKLGWEELPYWMKGYANTGYLLRDTAMIRAAAFWINTVLSNQRPNGDFGPARESKGNRDLWTNMPMLWCLQSYYEYSGDARVLGFMSRYFKYELGVPEASFLKDYWENSRGGDNIYSVYWLYNRTGERWLLDLATKIDRNTANWRQANDLPNWHNVNITQSYREPATYYLQSHQVSDRDATYHDYDMVRAIYGQVPGGLFGSDENARKGYDDPRQAVETCGMVEQMTSDQFLIRFTGDTKWADNCEDVAFNTFPAAFMPDYRSLRYLTAPNMVVSDSKNHAPGIANEGPFLMMNPFSSRCCQHNHGAGWAYYAENTWMATPDNGLAAQLYSEGRVRARAGADGRYVTIRSATHYPFSSRVEMRVEAARPVAFPLYLRIPAWCDDATVAVNGVPVRVDGASGGYVRVSRSWKTGDKVVLELPMKLRVRRWQANKNSVSVDYGALTFSLLIGERYVEKGSKETAQGDAGWQDAADAAKWPSYEIYAASPWNYGLELDGGDASRSFTVEQRTWPSDNNPFVNKSSPVVLHAKGRKIPRWGIDQYGLCGVLPVSPVASGEPLEDLTLVPMGGARLRISAFPVVSADAAAGAGVDGAGSDAGAGAVGVGKTLVNPLLPSGPDPFSWYKDGYYYYTHTMGNHLELWRTRSLAELDRAEHHSIFTPPPGQAYSKELWAPEIMFLDGKWYAYFAADSGNNTGHRMWVLENEASDPFGGKWLMKGKIAAATDKWAIDGDVFRYKGQLYMIWSGWEGDVNHAQHIYIARMSNPWTIEGERVRISSPDHGWEQHWDQAGQKNPPQIFVNEGPQALQHGDDLFVVYSGSACWTDTYALGLLRLAGGGDPMDASAWKKSEEPVFKQSADHGVYATGHNSFFMSPDGKENWILYHANPKPGMGCGNMRAPHAQPFGWKADGSPDFGAPVQEGVPIAAPSINERSQEN